MRSVLVANRGEIALRVIRGARERGIRTVAVYSEADRLAPHVLEADEAYLIGPAPAAQSYLRGDVLIEVARRSGAEAIHPGYGFLSERAEFARAVESAGLIFIGPSPDTIAAMGDKAEARRRMARAGVPIVPGSPDAVGDAADARRTAEQLGFPVLLKAAAGGGGKGMRVARDGEEVERGFEAAGREALGAFGDGRIYLERYVERPRHIEIQVFGDAHGNVVHLGERECSVQRRHQKLIEEAPSPVLSPEAREAMGDAAVRAAASVSYRGAGTVEFLYRDGEFFFLEMNTRLQVEHPVTELVTGIDLVDLQLRVASGEPLGFAQDDVRMQGHAMECRITSEDPHGGFLPSTGTISHLEIPGGPGVRWDGGIQRGHEVTLHYDPLLAKLITHGGDRAHAIARMARALDELLVVGVDTSAPYLRSVMEEPDFARGDLSIAYVDEHAHLLERMPADGDLAALALAGALLEEEHREHHRAPRIPGSQGSGMSRWRASGWPWGRNGWQNGAT
ncbi:MAG: acetyl/propionyl/methylcrotonyl-CoA carboxylase subunit alpha [Gemmatimonadales bacterium]